MRIPRATTARAERTEGPEQPRRSRAKKALDGIDPPRSTGVGRGRAAPSGSVRDHILAYESQSKASPSELAAKLKKLETSAFVFFRGTADLFYRGLDDRHQPKTLLVGDVHPENMGIRKTPEGGLFYGLDDFDEAAVGPFTWDLRRGATGLELAARERGFDPKAREEIVEAFFDGFRTAFEDPKKKPRYREGDVPKVLEPVFEQASKVNRSDFLEKYAENGHLRASAELAPQPDQVSSMQEAITKYRKSLHERAPDHPKKFFEVLDVATKTGSGTASIGLPRWYVLVRGPSKSDQDDVLLELKATRPSVLAPHVPKTTVEARMKGADAAEHIADAWSSGDAFAGRVMFQGREYQVRERLPEHSRVTLADLSASELTAYARVLGKLVGDFQHEHTPKKVRKAIGDALGDKDLRTSIVEGAAKAADQVCSEWESFRDSSGKQAK